MRSLRHAQRRVLALRVVPIALSDGPGLCSDMIIVRLLHPLIAKSAPSTLGQVRDQIDFHFSIREHDATHVTPISD